MIRYLIIFLIIIIIVGLVVSYFIFFLLPDLKQLVNQKKKIKLLASTLLLSIEQLLKGDWLIKEEPSQKTKSFSQIKNSSQSQFPSGVSTAKKQPSFSQKELIKKSSIKTEKPNLKINTYIISGPKEGEIINETTKITFKFKAKVRPPQSKNQIIFQTKVEGLDEDWQNIYFFNQRTVNFPPGTKEYTFLVRAKINNVVDESPAKRKFKINVSPYFGKIKIKNIKTPTSWSPYTLITLISNLKKGEAINITGWQIKSSKIAFTIPKGVEKYQPAYLLLNRSQIPTDNIRVQGFSKIYLSSALSPLNNISFRLNRCLGYLTNYYHFPIPIYKNCPKPSRYDEQFIKEISYLQPSCQKYILNLNYCQIPKHWEIPEVATDKECVNYLNKKFNYQGCFSEYSQDKNFLKNEWHIYINRNLKMGSLDIIYLKDKNGLVVDKYLYKF